MILTLRINETEVQMISDIFSSEKCESENRSEWLRLLIHREWNKRKKLGVPDSSYQTANRSHGGMTYRSRLLRFDERNRAGVIQRRRRKSPPLLISPSSTRAANGVSGRTKNLRVTRRAGFSKSAGKLR